ncbi:1,6-anhydro-N-acetylmuramyl-L-alanine amidase AmpD [Dickeya lacustris]|uniref:1,6-anhydro-N-acetylmuramyl-L-alanine amidase AmpD n=1 Tax=Dickeya lacustris TaxID=2259638 RepID=A0ABY8G4N5_9GAMM|nr:1,6-anhydro-N-acetylmuramyl-L-alanine amidase AmpD [Dickeya lacustris]WFN54894.1 1,6-anhydro-N-acetylmuramyl-L-alanine amidase AmpD [Dickeya lacustris]
MRVENGWLTGVTHILSPHQDERPQGELPSLLVIHNISLPPGEFGGPYIDRLFTGTLEGSDHPYFATISHLRVSAHCLIRRDGEVIQYVAFDKRAWHAGVSQFEGRERCNDFSIGIELEGTDSTPFTPEQYNRLAQVTRLLNEYYGITSARITGHSDIAPGRKTDPGPAFDWARYQQLWQAHVQKGE